MGQLLYGHEVECHSGYAKNSTVAPGLNSVATVGVRSVVGRSWPHKKLARGSNAI